MKNFFVLIDEIGARSFFRTRFKLLLHCVAESSSEPRLFRSRSASGASTLSRKRLRVRFGMIPIEVVEGSSIGSADLGRVL
jgi:hypothetical protein